MENEFVGFQIDVDLGDLQRAMRIADQFANAMNAVRTGAQRAAVAVGQSLAAGLSAVATGVQTMARNAIKAATELSTAIESRFAGAFSFVTFAAGIGIFKSLTTDMVKTSAHVKDLAEQLNLTTDQVQELGYAASLNGTTMDDAANGLASLGKKAVDAAGGGKKSIEIFRKLQVSVYDASGAVADHDVLLGRTADAFAAMPPSTKKTALALELFGDAGRKLIPLLNNGSAGLAKLKEEAHKLGIVMNANTIKAAAEYADQVTRLKAVSTGLRNMLAAKLLPILTKHITAFVKWASTGRNMERMIRAVSNAAQVMVVVFSALVAGRILAGLVTMAAAVMSIAKASVLAQLATAAWVVAWLAVMAIIEDVVTFVQGGDSMLGRLIGDPALVARVRGTLVEVWSTIQGLWVSLWPILVAVGEVAVATWKTLKQPLYDAWGVIVLIAAWVGKIAALVWPIVKSVGGALKEAVLAVLAALRSVWDAISPIVKALEPLKPILEFLGYLVIQFLLLPFRVLAFLLKGVAFALEVVADIIDWIVGKVGGPAMKAWTSLVNTVKQLWGYMKDIASSAFFAASEAVGKVWDAIVGKVKSLSNAVVGFLQRIGVLSSTSGSGSVDLGPGGVAGLRSNLAAGNELDAISAVKLAQRQALQHGPSLTPQTVTANAGGIQVTVSTNATPEEIAAAVATGFAGQMTAAFAQLRP